MKKFYFLIICTILILPTNNILAQENATNEDEIIEACLTFQPLMEKIPSPVKEQITEYFILNQEGFLNFSQNLKINGKVVSLIGKAQLDQVKLYFDFFTLNIENNKADVLYYTSYKVDNNTHTISTTIQFEKNNSVWEIINYSF